MRTRFKRVLLVAPDIFPEQILADFDNVKHIDSAAGFFPALFEFNPDLLIIDYNFLEKDIEKILRRIRINKFYYKLRISCYKRSANEKTDSLLKAIGVDHFFYPEDLAKPQKGKKVIEGLNAILDASIMKLMASVTH